MGSGEGRHTVRQYDQELSHLRQLVLEMGGLVEEQIARAVAALERGDTDSAREIVERDHTVNGYDVRIDEETISVIARRQPAATDLRMLMSMSKTATDLERIGDEAEKLARMTLRLAENGRGMANSQLVRDVSTMGGLARSMVHGALDALARLDVRAAVEIAQGDRELDREFQAALRRLITYMMEDPRAIGPSIEMLFAVKALERVGDHAKNIAEYVIYLVRGKDVRHTRVEDLVREIPGTDAP